MSNAPDIVFLWAIITFYFVVAVLVLDNTIARHISELCVP